MLSLTEILGEDNPLSRMVETQSRLFNASLRRNAGQLAAKAGNESGNRIFSYNGRAFRLKFQADLPNSHEHYWEAEVLIGDDAAPENDVMLPDDSLIRIIVHGHGGGAISEGNLNLLGLSLEVSDGKASCTLGDFRNNLTRRGVSFRVPGGEFVHGHLSF